MQTLLIFTVIALVVFAQQALRIFSGIDFTLPLIIAIIVKRSKTEGLVYSFFAGLIQDLIIYVSFMNVFTKTLLSVLINYLKNFLSMEDDSLCLIFAGIFTPIFFIVYYLAGLVFLKDGSNSFPLANMIVSTVFNLMLVLPAYKFLGMILKDE